MEPLTTPGNLQSLPAQAVNNHSLRLTKEQKIGLAVLSCFSLLIIVFWFMEMNKNITYPFYGGMSKSSFEQKIIAETGSAEQIAAASVAAEKKDTDGDGLTDTQELTVYKTSPFLADTDGDSFSDGEEIKNNTDPNCPEGKQCSADGMVVGTEQLSPSGTTTVDLFDAGAANNSSVSNNAAVTVQTLDSTSASTLQQAFGANPDPTYLREQLIQTATKQEDKDALQKISDEQLLQMYNSMINKQ